MLLPTPVRFRPPLPDKMTTDAYNGLTREQWLTKRREGIGASDAAAVCGLTPWATPLHVYLDKTSQLPVEPMTMAQKMGLLLEPVVDGLYCDRFKCETYQPDPLMKHPDHPWMMANLDRAVKEPRINVQLKTAGFITDDWGQDGTDEVPEQYLVQVQQEMAVGSFDMTHLAVLFLSNREFRVYEIPYNADVVADLIEIEREFWTQHVEAMNPPGPDWDHPRTPDLIQRLYGVEEGLTLTLNGEQQKEALQLIADMEEWKTQVKNTEGRIKEAKARLLYLMQEAELMDVGGGVMCTRKSVTRKPYSVGEKTYIDFRVKRKKG